MPGATLRVRSVHTSALVGIRERLWPLGQVICYAVLDIVAKVVFGFILTSSHEAIAQVMQGQAYVVIEPADSY